jgi:hypothetical protein
MALKCRLLAPLRDQTQFRVCIAADDSYFNLQQNTTGLTFTTRDGTPPLLSVNATTQSVPLVPGSTSRQCLVSITVQLSEAGSGVAVILAADTNTSSITPADIWNPVTLQPAWLQSAARSRTAFVIKGQSGGTKALPALPAPCDTKLSVIATASDAASNVAPNLEVLQVHTPDVLPPQFLMMTPRLSETANVSAIFEVALDEPGNCAVQVQ